MFAVVEISGKQFSVKEQDKVKTPHLDKKAGDKVKFDRVLLVSKDNKTIVGKPVVENASITGTVIEHGREDKVIVFKKYRRNDYKRTKGHRQDFSLVQIEKITAGGKKKAAAKPKKEEAPAPAEEVKTEE